MTIYKFRASIPESKIFMREYEVNGDISLFSLHNFLLNDLGFVPDQMVAFRGVDKDNKVISEYGLFDVGYGTMDVVTIERLIKRGENELLYVYDLHKNKVIRLSYIEIVEGSPRVSYPRLVAEKGRNPEQFASHYDDLDQFTDAVDDGGDTSVEYDESLESDDDGEYI